MNVPKIAEEVQSSLLPELRDIVVDSSDPLIALKNANRLPHFIECVHCHAALTVVFLIL